MIYLALRHICSNVTFVSGIEHVEMTKPLMLSASLSCQRYQAHCEEVKNKKLQAEKRKKRKLDMDGVDELREKRRRVIEIKDSLDREERD